MKHILSILIITPSPLLMLEARGSLLQESSLSLFEI